MASQHITMLTLVERIESEQVCPHGRGSGGALDGPRQRRAIIAGNPESALVDMSMVGKEAPMGKDASKFQVRDGNGALAMFGGDKVALNDH